MVLMKRLENSRQKGFTLVETIVVLIIIAVLASISVPSLTGYISNVNEKTVVSEARSVQMAMQEFISEQYGAGQHIKWVNANGGTPVKDGVTIAYYVMNLAGQEYTPEHITNINTSGSAIVTFAYKKDNMYAGYNAYRTPKYKVALSPSEAIAN